MTLHCPFCNANEDGRVVGKDEGGRSVILVMFGCPFYYQFSNDEIGTDEKMQTVLNEWRKENGEEWLESIGPAMKSRELRNIERSRSTA